MSGHTAFFFSEALFTNSYGNVAAHRGASQWKKSEIVEALKVYTLVDMILSSLKRRVLLVIS